MRCSNSYYFNKLAPAVSKNLQFARKSELLYNSSRIMKNIKNFFLIFIVLMTTEFCFGQELLDSANYDEALLTDGVTVNSENELTNGTVTEDSNIAISSKVEQNFDVDMTSQNITKNVNSASRKKVFRKFKVQPFFFNAYPQGADRHVSDSIYFSNSRASNKGIFLNALTTALYNNVDYFYGRNLSAVQLSENSTSFLTENIYWFFKLYDMTFEVPNIIFRLGADVHYNLQVINNVSVQNNFFYGLIGEVKSGKWFYIRSHIFAGNRVSKIFGESSVIHNWDFQADIAFLFNTPIHLSPYISISTYETFRYPLFCSPNYTFGLLYITQNNFRVGLEGSLRYIDAFTLSSFLDSYVIRLVVGYDFR